MMARFELTGLCECLLEAKSRVSLQQPKVLASFSSAYDNREPVELFAANYRHEQPVSFWGTPLTGYYYIGFGSAYEFNGTSSEQSLAQIQEAWQQLLHSSVVSGGHQPILSGGFAFDRLKPSSPLWRDFPQGSLTLPKLAFCSVGDDSSLLISNILVDSHSNCELITRKIEAQWQRILSRTRTASASCVSLLWDDELIDSEADPMIWQRRVAEAVEHIKHGDMQKVVLARAHSSATSCCPGDILDYLQEKYPDAFLFAFVRGASCFLGASPERLVACHGGDIRTVALAGSAPRGENEEADKRLGLSLLNSRKDRHEHELVVRQLCAILDTYCESLSVPEQPALHKLMHIQHLLTPLIGRAKDGVKLLQVLADLHPSAAVGGLPRQTAIDYIRDHEDLDRGWYAAPVGWLNAEGDGEFAVALRSVLLTQGRATLFAGCGLVEASVPAHEYRESRIKMNAIKEAIRSVSIASQATG